MRKSVVNMGWLKTGAGEISGVSFGFDFCSEHEEGISGLCESFGVGKYGPKGFRDKIVAMVRGEKDLVGVERRRMVLTGGLVYGSGEVSHISFTASRSAKWLDHLIKEAKDALDRGTTDPVCYWGKNEFLIVSKDHEAISKIEKFITSGDAILLMNQAGLGSGVVIHSISLLPDEVKEGMKKSDEMKIRLDAAVDKTGIVAMLSKARCNYFALNPRWKDETEQEVVFWLNPYNQKENNSGWYALNELKQWIEGKGPIPKKNQPDTIKEESPKAS